MKGCLIYRGAMWGLLLLALVAVESSILAQTARPKTKTAAAAPAYRYAYQHGYRAGYEDGFTKGKSDFNENSPRDFASSEAFNKADRTYKDSMGTFAEYQEGYRLGFELGYQDGYYGRVYTTTLPANLGKVVIATLNAAGGPPAPAPGAVAEPARPAPEAAPAQAPPSRARSRGTVNIPDGVEMKLRLTSQINTKTNQEGDRFTAVVLDPSEYADAIVEGHIAKLNKSGKATGKTELALAFDSIQLRDGRGGKLAGQVEKVYESETVKTVDEEGNVQTGSRTKETAVRGAGGAALGAIIGGIAGGGKGAAIGAAIGAGVGVGSVFIQGGKDLILEPGTEILIRTAAPASAKSEKQ